MNDRALWMTSLTAVAMASAISLLAPHTAHAAALPPEVLGTWGLSEAAADLVAPNCRSLTYHFDPTTLTETHHEMVLKTSYDVVDGAPTWTLRRVVAAYNGRPNCIGALVPFALGQRLPDLRIELQGERLRLHLREIRGGTRHVDLVRVNRPAGHAAASSGAAKPTLTIAHRTDPGAAMKCGETAYPEVAEREGAQGVTRIRFSVDAQGMAIEPHILNGSGTTRAHRVLDRAAVEALATCAFPLDRTPPGTAMVVDYVWRLPDAARPGQ